MKVYMDEVIIKSLLGNTHLANLQECFKKLRGNNVKLNPKKRTFALSAGKFLG